MGDSQKADKLLSFRGSRMDVGDSHHYGFLWGWRVLFKIRLGLGGRLGVGHTAPHFLVGHTLGQEIESRSHDGLGSGLHDSKGAT